ncbi:hypothetical protein CGZ75_00265 [Paenibacillus herberti]|uniref:Uncharacterized protein n=1 Tax=Paenibacillus herberti TaxID=1619309 RepID=A0A229P028_9BACL|nr:hypothetical protein CGZ75_00265 [Paenibacillus herberti]
MLVSGTMKNRHEPPGDGRLLLFLMRRGSLAAYGLEGEALDNDDDRGQRSGWNFTGAACFCRIFKRKG